MDSLRIGLLAKGCAVTLVAACAACSSSSAAPQGAVATASDGGVTSAEAGPVVDGTGADCPTLTTTTVATKVALNVYWPPALAVSGVSKTAPVPLYLWLLSVYNIDGSNKITGTTTTCGNVTPPIALNGTGDMAEGVPSGQTGQVQITIPASSWAGVPTSSVTGVLGGWKTGSSVTIYPVVTLYGISPTSALADGAKPWPGKYSDIAPTDLTFANGTAYDADAGMGFPGVIAVPSSANGFYLPTTSISGPPLADQLNIVLRTEISLYGTSSSCTEQTGQAFVPDLNNHVVGCRLADDGGPCNSDQYGFIDSQTTQYVPTSGTFDAKTIATGATCADVLTTLP